MTPTDQQLIKKGLQQLNEQAKGKFSSLSKEEKQSLAIKKLMKQPIKMMQIKHGLG